MVINIDICYAACYVHMVEVLESGSRTSFSVSKNSHLSETSTLRLFETHFSLIGHHFPQSALAYSRRCLISGLQRPAVSSNLFGSDVPADRMCA